MDNNPITYPNTVALLIEVDVQFDGRHMVREVLQTLEQYIEFMKRNNAGNRAHEVYVSPTGTKLTVIAPNRNATQIPYEKSLLQNPVRDQIALGGIEK